MMRTKSVISCKLTDTIETIKVMYENITGMKAECLRLHRWNGESLEDKKSLQE